MGCRCRKAPRDPVLDSQNGRVLAEALRDYSFLHSNRIRSEKALRELRRAICNRCSHRKKDACTKCEWCVSVIEDKISVKDDRCPLAKW